MGESDAPAVASVEDCWEYCLKPIGFREPDIAAPEWRLCIDIVAEPVVVLAIMPDLDYIERSFNRGWRGAWRLAKGKHDDELLAAELVKALARTRRVCGGMPGFRRLTTSLSRFGSGELKAKSVEHVAHRLEMSFGQTRHAKIAARSAMACAAGAILSRAAVRGDAELAEEYCLGLLENQFFSKTQGHLIGERFDSPEAFGRWKEGIQNLLRPGIHKMAESLRRDPTASKLRAPSLRRSRRRSTLEQLDEPVL